MERCEVNREMRGRAETKKHKTKQINVYYDAFVIVSSNVLCITILLYIVNLAYAAWVRYWTNNNNSNRQHTYPSLEFISALFAPHISFFVSIIIVIHFYFPIRSSQHPSFSFILPYFIIIIKWELSIVPVECVCVCIRHNTTHSIMKSR